MHFKMSSVKITDVHPKPPMRSLFRLAGMAPLRKSSAFFSSAGGGACYVEQTEYENKNLAIANRLCVSCADNTLRTSKGLNITPSLKTEPLDRSHTTYY